MLTKWKAGWLPFFWLVAATFDELKNYLKSYVTGRVVEISQPKNKAHHLMRLFPTVIKTPNEEISKHMLSQKCSLI